MYSFCIGVPGNLDFWGEEEVRRLYELQGNEVVASHFRREKACKDTAFF